ncbi:MAG TPA: type II toxin-antitoxin system Phd/YefM family antitoxin [Candidatus Saccharimonadales bacterium]|nr:type II toxin-antitoxin system Phd/YefM family antitoxin [Candidatus Saccharimonadales bacterium]
MKVTSISDFRKDTKKYFDQVIDDQDALLITRSDGQTIVAIPLDQYNSIAETEYLLSSPANRERLLQSLADLRAGKGQARQLTET